MSNLSTFEPMVEGARQNFLRFNTARLQLSNLFDGIVTVSVASSVTFTGASSQIYYRIINLTSAPDATKFLAFPAGSSFERTIINDAGYDVTVKLVGSTGVVIPNGATVTVCSDGTEVTSLGSSNGVVATGSSAAGNVPFVSSGNTLTYDSGLQWDNSAKRLGVGAASPAAKAHIVATSEQLRVGYDSGNYLSINVLSGSSRVEIGTTGAGGIKFLNAIGVGASPSPTASINNSTDTSDANMSSLSNTMVSHVTSSASRFLAGWQNNQRALVASGVTNSGYMYGVNQFILRAYLDGFDDSGRSTALGGFNSSQGHTDDNPTASPLSTAVYGALLTPYAKRGTIDTYYGVYLASPVGISLPATWTSTTYAVGAIRKPSTPNSRYFVVSAIAGSGAAGVSEPTWNTTVGATTTDGDVTWKAILIPSITAEYGIYQQSANAVNYFAGAFVVPDRFKVTDVDTVQRHVVQAAAATKTTAAAPYTNDGYVELVINGSTVKVMTTA